VSGQATLRPLIGTNWKMHLTPSETDAYLRVFRELVADLDDRDLFVLPAFPALQAARDRLQGSNVAWGAQDVHATDRGPHTGDVSAPMLADLGCHFVEVGHTERRRDHGESYEVIGAKVAAVVRSGMVPIICIGEQQQMGPEAALGWVLADLDRATAALGSTELPEIVVAYEPSWAIGQGMVAAPPADIAAVHRGIHTWLEQRGFGPARARVIYGGSVDGSVAEELLRQPGVDGVFIGRAGLDPERFAAIARTPLPVRAPATS
jgi:triosephosphate isomerase (TIM)